MRPGGCGQVSGKKAAAAAKGRRERRGAGPVFTERQEGAGRGTRRGVSNAMVIAHFVEIFG